MIIGSKNKGDWSEFYVLLYLLGTRKLYTADEKLQKIDGFYFPINKIMRCDSENKNIDFTLDGIDKVKIYFNGELSREMTSAQFIDEANYLYSEMRTGRSSFNIPRSENFLNGLGLNRLAAPASELTDIRMELHDTYTGINQVMGFSIKSYIGNKPTLLNASGATNFVYEVIGISQAQKDEINAIETREKIMDRMRAIADFGGRLEYRNTVNRTFSDNLLMIDSRMEEILADFLKYSYATNIKDCKSIVEHLEIENPLNYSRSGIYTYKFKEFLCAKALGMEPGDVWTGEDIANGGYIVAKSDGEVLAYHLYNRDKFKQYLYENTKTERASTTRHGYAKIYEQGGKMLINLNLQIRFK